MRKWVGILMIGTALALGGCAGMQASQKEDTITKDTVIRCPKCGAEFKVGEGVRGN